MLGSTADAMFASHNLVSQCNYHHRHHHNTGNANNSYLRHRRRRRHHHHHHHHLTVLNRFIDLQLDISVAVSISPSVIRCVAQFQFGSCTVHQLLILLECSMLQVGVRIAKFSQLNVFRRCVLNRQELSLWPNR